MLDVSDFAHSMRMVNDLNYSLVALGSVRADKEGWCYRNFYINFNKIYFMREGEVTITKKDTGEKCFLRPGYVYFIPANHEYDFTTPSCFDKVFLHVSVGMIDGRDLFSLVHEIVELPYDMSVFETLEDKLAREELDAVIKMKEITNQILYRVMALKPECIEKRLKIVTDFSPLILSVIEYVNANISGDLKIVDIAKQFAVSSQTLSNKFRDEVGISLKKYINTCITDKAQDMLLQTDLSVKEIAFQLGFSDQYNFSKFFKSCVYRSPSEYREAYINYYGYAHKKK